jgi:Kef-type K+ transport system membrane component KefB/Trk K+ transport system NAD-binding subunit
MRALKEAGPCGAGAGRGLAVRHGGVEMITGSPFYEVAIILGLAAALGAVGQKLRQPLIIMFLATGILAGPACLGVIESYEQIELLAHIGIALLLFIVGLRLDLHLIRTTGAVALATGLGQIVFTSVIGLFIALALGMEFISAAYVAVALTFSSTIIIVKLLSDKKEIDSLHGRIAVGFLIVQDIAAIAALVGLTTLGSVLPEGESSLVRVAGVIGKAAALLTGVGLVMRWVLPPLLLRMAGSPEMMNVFAVAWAVLLGALSDQLGFSKEVGAFLAGVSLASTDYRDAIGARLTGLRDFLLLFFFIDLGARLDWSTVGDSLGAAVLFSLFVLIGNPLIVMAVMGVMGYRRRTGFLAGLTVAQISEFSLIVAALGVGLGHITPETMGLITLVGVVTIFASTYMILYSGPLYRMLSPSLRLFERRDPYRETQIDAASGTPVVDVVLVGLGNYGRNLAEHLVGRKKSVVGVDFNPHALETWRARGLAVLYGDVGDPELHEHLPLDRSHWVVSTVRSRELSLALLNLLRQRRYEGKVALTAATPDEAALYKEAGAHVVLRPFADAAEQAADALTYAMDLFPSQIDWPIAFREIRLRAGSVFTGQSIRQIPLRSATGTSILAVSRAGRVHYDPDPEFKVYPGDRLVVMGSTAELKQAEELLHQQPEPEPGQARVNFTLDEIEVCDGAAMVGRTLAELKFRQKYAVTVVGIRRGEARIPSPNPNEPLQAGDRLIVVGTVEAVRAMACEL